MLLSLFSSNTPAVFGLLTFCLVLLSVSIHESAHALAAYLLGDPTAKLEDRLTLNPIQHFSVWGLLALVLTGIGWGKPVPINPGNFDEPVRDSAIVSFAGPLSNFIFAGVLIGIMKIAQVFLTGLAAAHTLDALYMAVYVTVSLGVFNLLPVWHLDGFKIFSYLLPDNLRLRAISFMQTFGLILLILVIGPFLPGGQSIFGIVFTPVAVGLDALISAVGLL